MLSSLTVFVLRKHGLVEHRDFIWRHLPEDYTVEHCKLVNQIITDQYFHQLFE